MRKSILLTLVAGALVGGANSLQAWCMWGAVQGINLGYIGYHAGGGVAGLSTARGSTTLNTQSDKKAIFFGYVGNEITVSRDGRQVAHCGDHRLAPRYAGGYALNPDISGNYTHQPGWLLLQSPLVTRIYACQPHGHGHFRMAGGQGARWSTSATPVINEVRQYNSNVVDWTATGYGVITSQNWNWVSLIDMDELWPCEMIADFATPAGSMAIKSVAGTPKVNLYWDSGWDCNYSAGEAADENNILFTITGEANPSEGGTISGLGKYHVGETANVFARANEGYEFSKWEGGYSGNPAGFGVLVDGNIHLVAGFRKKMIPVTLKVRAVPSSGNNALAGASIFVNGRSVKSGWAAASVSYGEQDGTGPVSSTVEVMVPSGSRVWFDALGGASKPGDGDVDIAYEGTWGGKTFQGAGRGPATIGEKLGEKVITADTDLGTLTVRALD